MIDRNRGAAPRLTTMLRRLLPVLLLLLPLPAAAHPHVWIDATLAFRFDGKSLVALDITWRFDELYSELVAMDFDTDGDGTLSQQELDALVGVSAANLADYSFFTHLKIGEETPQVHKVQAFYAESGADGTISYRFTVPLPQPLDPRATPFAVGLYDETYYVDVALAPADVTLDPASGCSTVARNDVIPPLYYGAYYPTYLVLQCGDAKS